MRKTFWVWVPFIFLVSFVCVVVYAAVQTSIRSGANDPQVAILENIIAESNADPKLDLTPLLGTVIDMKTSLAPFVVIFNDGGAPIASSAVLNNKTPVPPAGVFKYVATHEDHRFTWQPQPGVRAAVVMRKLEGTRHGFVLVGRSLREVENRVGEVAFVVLLSWIIGLVLSFLYSYFATHKFKK
jgi:hypothetical protein